MTPLDFEPCPKWRQQLQANLKSSIIWALAVYYGHIKTELAILPALLSPFLLFVSAIKAC